MRKHRTDPVNGTPSSFLPAPVFFRDMHMAMEIPSVTAKKTTLLANTAWLGTSEKASGQLETLLPLPPPPPRLGAIVICRRYLRPKMR